MSLPSGPRAQAKLAYYRRAKRRSKRDLSEFLRQGITPLAPFDFGTVAAGGSSLNTLTLRANATFVLEYSVAAAIGDAGITDGTTDYTNAEAFQAGGFVEIRRQFRRDQGIQITRAIGAPAGSVNVYFLQVGGIRTLIGQATFT